MLTHLHFAEAVVGHLVHETVEQRRGAGLVYSELSLGGEVVTFLKGTREEGEKEASKWNRDLEYIPPGTETS